MSQTKTKLELCSSDSLRSLRIHKTREIMSSSRLSYPLCINVLSASTFDAHRGSGKTYMGLKIQPKDVLNSSPP